MIQIGRDLGDRLLPTRNRCGIFIIIATILSQNNTGNFPKHKPELTKTARKFQFQSQKQQRLPQNIQPA